MIFKTINHFVMTDSAELASNQLLEFRKSIPYFQNLDYPGPEGPGASMSGRGFPLLDELQDTDRKTLPDLLAAFPILNKDNLITLGENLYKSPGLPIVLFSETSGTTTGVPLPTPRSASELRLHSSNISTAFLEHLDPKIDRVAIIVFGIMTPFPEAATLALQSIGVPYLKIFPITDVCDYSKIFRVLTEYKITAILSTPTLANKLLFERTRQTPQSPWSVNKLLLTGESLGTGSRRHLDASIGCQGAARCFIYGSSEVGTAMIGLPNGRYRALTKDFIFEVIPHKQLLFESPEGIIKGSLVITSLHNAVRPLVRYNTGDCVAVFPTENGHFELLPLGRTIHQDISPEMSWNVDNAIYDFPHPVFHYDLRLNHDQQDATVHLVTSINPNTKLDLVNDLKSLELALSEIISKPVRVILNPENHLFNRSTFQKTNHVTIS